MTDARRLAGLAHLLADETRASVCLALLDGRAWTATELAQAARVAPSTMSAHLDLLVDGGLLAQERQGRHRYVRLAGERAAALVEDVAGHCDPAPPALGSLRVVSTQQALAPARTCYDHLAGRLGVDVLDALSDKGYLLRGDGLALTAAGADWLTELGVDVAALRVGDRPLVRGCLDWTERRPHLAGAAGAALCGRFLALGWMQPGRRPRALRVTDGGRAALADELGQVWAA